MTLNDRLTEILCFLRQFNSLWYRTFLRTHSQGEINSYLRSQITQLSKYKEQLKTNVRGLLSNLHPEDKPTAHLGYLDSTLQQKRTNKRQLMRSTICSPIALVKFCFGFTE